MIQAGMFREPVRIEAPVESQSETGQMSDEFEDVFPGEDIRAGVRALSGNEYIAAQQIVSGVTTRITMRYRREINETCRLVHIVDPDQSPPIEDVYDILAVLPDPVSGRRHINLMCVLRKAEGMRRGR